MEHNDCSLDDVVNNNKIPHSLIIESRNKLLLTGVTEIGAFDEESLSVFTSYGEITVTGENIQVSVMNTSTGEVSAQGKIDSVKYSDKTAKKTGFLTKVFR